MSLTIFSSLLALLVITTVPYGTVEPWWEALFECLIFFLAILSIIEITIGGNIKLMSYTLVCPIIALIIFAFIQTLNLGTDNISTIGGEMWNPISADPLQTRRWILKMLALVAAGAMLLRHTSNERRLQALTITILLLSVATALFGILRQTTQRREGFLFLTHLPAGSGYAQFINKNHFAFLAEISLGLALGILVAGGIKKERKLIYLALSLPLWAGLILCNSRGGLFSMFGQLLFLAIMWSLIDRAQGGMVPLSTLERLRHSWPMRLLLLCSLLIFILIGTVWLGGGPLISRLEAVQGEIGTADSLNQGTSRVDIWRSTVSLIKEHPLLGVGFGGYWASIPQYHIASGEITPQEAHNDYLELIASGGLIGLILVVWFMIIFIKRARKVWVTTAGYPKAASLGALTGIFGVALHSLVDFGLHITINALLFTTLIVITTVGIKAKENKAS
jgi:O-antigen ligase